MSNPYPANVLRPDGTVSQEGFVNFTDSENQPGGAWGQAATAAYVGSGSPVGVVTPSGEGDLYVDNTTPALWQATGDTDSDWQEVGSGGASPLTLTIPWESETTTQDGTAYIASPNLLWIGNYDNEEGYPITVLQGIVVDGVLTDGWALYGYSGGGAQLYSFANSVGAPAFIAYGVAVGPWGVTITSGSASPVGSITPLSVGQLFVDSGTPALWQATGDTSEDWTQVGGSGGLAISREITNLVFADAPTVIAYNAGPTLFGVAIADPPSFMDDASNITEAGIYVVGVKILVTNAPTIPGQYGLWESPDQITALPFPANQLDLGYLNLDSIVAITADDLPFALSNTINMQTDVSGTLQASGFVGQLASA